MSIGLTLGTTNLLNNFEQPFILLKPAINDELAIRVELNGNQYAEILNNNFQWHFTHYKFIYLNFNPDQTSLFANKFINHSYFDQSQHILILNDQSDINKFVIVIGNMEQISSTRITTDLKTLSTNEFGLFSKSYTLI